MNEVLSNRENPVSLENLSNIFNQVNQNIKRTNKMKAKNTNKMEAKDTNKMEAKITNKMEAKDTNKMKANKANENEYIKKTGYVRTGCVQESKNTTKLINKFPNVKNIRYIPKYNDVQYNIYFAKMTYEQIENIYNCENLNMNGEPFLFRQNMSITAIQSKMYETYFLMSDRVRDIIKNKMKMDKPQGNEVKIIEKAGKKEKNIEKQGNEVKNIEKQGNEVKIIEKEGKEKKNIEKQKKFENFANFDSAKTKPATLKRFVLVKKNQLPYGCTENVLKICGEDVYDENLRSFLIPHVHNILKHLITAKILPPDCWKIVIYKSFYYLWFCPQVHPISVCIVRCFLLNSVSFIWCPCDECQREHVSNRMKRPYLMNVKFVKVEENFFVEYKKF
jgi:hypothetical protein